jgi:hypothetical protein
MAPLTFPGVTTRRPSPTFVVRERLLALEPVTRDPFIDELSDRGAARRVITPQSVLVRESLLRLGDREERR